MTQIQTAPLDITVNEGTEAKFTCTATTDPEEVNNLEINWKKDGEMIDFQLAPRYSTVFFSLLLHTMRLKYWYIYSIYVIIWNLIRSRVYKNSCDNSLTIRPTLSLYTGKYTCVASNGLDEDEASAQLIVQGPHEALGLHPLRHCCVIGLLCYYYTNVIMLFPL